MKNADTGLEINMLQKSTYTVSLWKIVEGKRSEQLEVKVEALTAGEALKKAEFRNPGFEASAARISG